MANKTNTIVVRTDTLSKIMDKVIRDVKAGKDKSSILNTFARSVSSGRMWGAITNTDKPVYGPGASPADLGVSPQKPEDNQAKEIWVATSYTEDGLSTMVFASKQEVMTNFASWVDMFKRDFPGANYDQSPERVYNELIEFDEFYWRYEFHLFQTPALSPSTPDQEDSEQVRQERALMAAQKIDFIECEFSPREFIDGWGLIVKPDGPTVWEMTVPEALDLMGNEFIQTTGDILSAKDRRELRKSIHAPKIAKEWEGPFEIQVTKTYKAMAEHFADRSDTASAPHHEPEMEEPASSATEHCDCSPP